MNKLRLSWPWSWPRWDSGRLLGTRGRRWRSPGGDLLQLLEARQLLASLTVSYSASVPVQVTDYTATLSLPKFNPSLGTLTEVDLTFAASGNIDGTVTNNGGSPHTLSISETVNVSLSGGATVLLAPVLNASKTFTNLPGNGGVGNFGPFTPSDSASATYTTGTAFDQFGGGPGNLDLSVQTSTGQAITGGGGNIAQAITTTVGAGATVVYRYTTLPVTLAGNVYDDVGGTGSLAPGDPPIPGTVLTLLDSNGAFVVSTLTNADGSYSFTSTAQGDEIPSGTYSIVETQPAGYLQGTNTVGTVNGVTDGALLGVDIIGSIALAQGQNSIGNNFGEVLPVGIAGTVYEDLKGNGALTPGDPAIVGVTLTLLDTSGQAVATTTTDGLGAYSFTTTTAGAPLPPGTYTVIETQPAGYLQGTNTVGTVNGVTDGALLGVDIIGSIALKSGQASLGNNFGEVLPVALDGTVYVDVNHTGSFAAGDPPIPGVTVKLFDPIGLVASTTTDALGHYVFTASASGAPLPPSTYAIVESQPAGFLQGTNTVGTVNGVAVGTLPGTDIIGSIALTSGQSTIGNNFGEITPTPPPPPPPPPLNVVNVQRFGVHLQPTLVVLTFDTPLDPATAGNVANYQVFGPTDSKHPASVPIESATYNPATDMVTLHLGARLDVHHPYRLTVSGLTNSSGGLLVGSNGVAGGSFVATLSRSSLAGFTDIYGNFIPIDHGKLYPAAIASGYQLKRFVAPANLGSFAAANKATFLAATANSPEVPPIAHRLSRKLPKGHH